MWAKFAASLSTGAILVVLLVVFVGANTADKPALQDPQARREVLRQANILTAQDQAPHTATLAPREAPNAGLERAVSGEMNQLIAHSQIDGPVTRTSCDAAGPNRTRLTFRCDSLAAGVKYPFLGVVDPSTREITYCKSDPPPIPSGAIPVSSRCR